jgi:hypothetical protein
MSQDDQIAAVGRLALERAEARRQLAMIRSTIQSVAENLKTIGSGLAYSRDDEYSKRLPAINDMISRGGLDQLKSSVESAVALQGRIAEMDKRAKEAGID